MPCTLSQVPQGFNYQAIARDGGGAVLSNTPLQVMLYIQSSSSGGTLFWKELHSSVTTNVFGLFNVLVGNGTRQSESTIATFDLIDWGVSPKYLKTEIYYSSSWKDMGTTQLYAVPYAMTAKSLTGTAKLGIKGTTSNLEEALFEVKNKDGQTVFAVYNEGVRIYVSDGAKAVKGGFAVGGFGTDKAESTKYLFVGKDSVRVYLDINPLTKKLKGGFAVGGYDLTKGIIMQDYLDVNSDSVRIYIDSDPATKKVKGGFAVGGYDMTKTLNSSYMNVTTDAGGIINPGQNKVLWYPLKNAFRTGRVRIRDSNDVGENSFATGYEPMAKGNYSQAMGYKAVAQGINSTAIGAGAAAMTENSFAFGDSTIVWGIDAYAFGTGANASGNGSYAFGSAGRDTVGEMIGSGAFAAADYSFAMGMGSAAYSITSFAIGNKCESTGTGAFSIGTNTIASGIYSTSLGHGANSSGTYSTSIGVWSKASGWNSTAIGDSSSATAYNSVAIGNNTTSYSPFETTVGVWNSSYVPVASNGWNNNDRIFVVGNGRDFMTRSNAMTILKNGCVGLQSITNPVYALQLPNNINPGVGSGQAYAWTTYSDTRLKENQSPINYGLAEVMELVPKKYIHHNSIDQGMWKTDNASETIGLIAQDVFPVIPEAVNVPKNDPTELWGLNYDKLIPVLIKAIQEQQTEIESYKTRLRSLQEKVDKIENLLAKALDE